MLAMTCMLKSKRKMDINQLKQEVIDYAHSIGIDHIGFTTADPFDELKQSLKIIIVRISFRFEEPDINLRTEPKLFCQQHQLLQ